MKSLNDRIYTLDALKFFAAVGIVFHHYQQVTGVRFPRFNFFGGRIYFGYLVELFFILSGFFMAVHIDKNKKLRFNQFLLNKIIRLYPMSIISVTVFCCAAWIFRFLTGEWWQNTVVGIWKTFLSLLLLHTGGVISVGIAANNPTWYLCVLLICYMLYWFILWLADKLGIMPFYLFVSGMFIGIGVGSFGINLPFLNGRVARGYTGFFWGIVLHYILSSGLSKFKMKFAAFILLILCAIAWIADPNELYDNFSMILVYLVYPSVIILMLTSKTLNLLFNHKICGILGSISFEMYLWHSPIMVISAILIYLTDYHPEYTYASMIAFTILVFVISALIYFMIEVPVTHWLKKINLKYLQLSA